MLAGDRKQVYYKPWPNAEHLRTMLGKLEELIRMFKSPLPSTEGLLPVFICTTGTGSQSEQWYTNGPVAIHSYQGQLLGY